MTWRDRLRPASFRGVPFKVDEADKEFGRRTQLDEYPDRDDPYVEDQGRRARRYPIRAYVVGPDYDQARDALDAALEQQGPGTLIHPYRGTLQVRVGRVRATESSREGGLCTYEIEFMEAGVNRQPSSAVDTVAVSNAAADTLTTQVSADAADTIDTSGLPAFVADSGADVFSQALAAVQAAVNGLQAAGDALFQFNVQLQVAQTQTPSLIAAPDQLASAFAGLLATLSSLASTPDAALAANQTLFTFGSAIPPVPGATPARIQQQANQAALIRLVQRSAAAEAVRNVSAMTFASRQDALSVRDSLADSLDSLALDAGDAGQDDAYLALVDLRTALIQDLTARGASLQPLISYTPRRTVPALVLAWRIYADATRDLEIVARNAITAPSFVPGGVALELLAPVTSNG